VEPISSTDNPQVRLARSLHEPSGRRKHAAFLVEGLRLVEAAVEAGAPQLVFHSVAFGLVDGRERALLRRLAGSGAGVRAVTDRVLQHVSDTVTPQGIVAVMSLPGLEPTRQRAALEARRVVGLDLILDGVSDPGNAGTLLRSAAAAGVGRIFCVPGTVDVYGPKVVRAGAGAHFQLSLVTGADADWRAIQGATPACAGVYLAEARGSLPYWEVDWTRPSVLIVGSEAHGASEAARQLAATTITIPMAGDVESLNAAVAGSIILFEALRQRSLT